MKFLERALDGKNQFWRYLIVCLSGFICGQLIGSIPLVTVIIVKTYVNNGIGPEGIMDFVTLGISKNLWLFLMILPFVVSLFLTIYLIKELHNRTFTETVNGTKKIRIKRICTGAVVWVILMAIYLIIDYSFCSENYILKLDWGNFVVLIILSLCLLPLQTTFEELMFRGYLTQGVAAWTKNRWLAVLIPGLIFGLIHIFNPEVKEFGFWLAMPQYIFFGLLFGLISVLDDGIELAIGMHAANNIFLSIFATHTSSALQTDALFVVPTIYPVKELIVLVVTGLIALTYFAHRYKWNFRILNQKVNDINNI